MFLITGEVSDSESADGSDVDSGEEFFDGLGPDLMGDEEDRKMLAQMTEKEREQELFNRIEKREVLRIRLGLRPKNKYVFHAQLTSPSTPMHQSFSLHFQYLQ